LDAAYSLSNHDVICGRGKVCFNHPGNQKLRELVASSLKIYSQAACKVEKSIIVSNIVDVIRRGSPNGGFVKQDPSGHYWLEVGDRLAREKVGQTLRDALSTQYRSSRGAKNMRRKMDQTQSRNQEDTTTTSELLIEQCNYEVSAVMVQLTTEVNEDLPDAKCEELFTAANVAILEKVKRSEVTCDPKRCLLYLRQ
jgi:hypothetical protein